MHKKVTRLKAVKRKRRMNVIRSAASTKNNIRNWRLFRKIRTHGELSARTFRLRGREGILRPTISRLETGKLDYRQSQLETLAIVLECSPAELISVNPFHWGDDALGIYYSLSKPGQDACLSYMRDKKREETLAATIGGVLAAQ